MRDKKRELSREEMKDLSSECLMWEKTKDPSSVLRLMEKTRDQLYRYWSVLESVRLAKSLFLWVLVSFWMVEEVRVVPVRSKTLLGQQHV